MMVYLLYAAGDLLHFIFVIDMLDGPAVRGGLGCGDNVISLKNL